jgi:four helix bundle protein
MVSFGTRASVLARGVRREVGGDHIARQLVRSATSAVANYAEACDAESRADFVHKVRIALKELRETSVWLRMIQGLHASADREALIKECHELIAIFVASAKTAQAGISNPQPRLSNRRSSTR